MQNSIKNNSTDSDQANGQHNNGQKKSTIAVALTVIVNQINQVMAKFRQYPKAIKLIIASTAMMVCAGIFYAAFYTAATVKVTSTSQKGVYPIHGALVKQAHANPINDQLEDISAKLANLEKNLSANAYVDLNSVRKAIASLQSQVSHLAQHSNQMLTKQIQSSTQQLQGQLSGIQKTLVSLNEQKSHHKLLSPSRLPFKVVDIANIQQNNIVSIRYAHKIFPLYAGDAIAGWTVTQVSSINQVAEFKNKDDNYVQIHLNNTELEK